jgi:hypothetical protein
MPQGLECYRSVTQSSDNCIPCKGIYFRVEKHLMSVEVSKEFKTALENYKEYKSGFNNGTEGK